MLCSAYASDDFLTIVKKMLNNKILKNLITLSN